jgi:hypothetical protein
MTSFFLILLFQIKNDRTVLGFDISNINRRYKGNKK